MPQLSIEVRCSGEDCNKVFRHGETYVADRDATTGKWVVKCTGCCTQEELQTKKVRFMHDGPAWVLTK